MYIVELPQNIVTYLEEHPEIKFGVQIGSDTNSEIESATTIIQKHLGM